MALQFIWAEEFDVKTWILLWNMAAKGAETIANWHSHWKNMWQCRAYENYGISSWASCQIRKIAGCACAGNAGNVFPVNRRLAIPTCITTRAWRTCRDVCRDRLLAVYFEVGGGENVPGITGACATRNFMYLVRGPLHIIPLYECPDPLWKRQFNDKWRHYSVTPDCYLGIALIILYLIGNG